MRETFRQPVRKREEDSDGIARAPLNAKVSQVSVAAGDVVAEGQSLMVLEAMKMEHHILAVAAGQVKSIPCVRAIRSRRDRCWRRSKSKQQHKRRRRRGTEDERSGSYHLRDHWSVLTDPRQHPVPVTPEELAHEAKIARDAGASMIHVHFRRQSPGKGHLPSWDPKVAARLRERDPRGVPGDHHQSDYGCRRRGGQRSARMHSCDKPEIAACNAGSLNYLKVKADGNWAWPPTPVRQSGRQGRQVSRRDERMQYAAGVRMFRYRHRALGRDVSQSRNVSRQAAVQFRDGRGVRHACGAGAIAAAYQTGGRRRDVWSVTAIGRENIWPLHRRAAELGGQLRTGVEDTFYLPDGKKRTPTDP
jgi:3-keto-5-aminohexanoate cleavage enzyme